MEKTNSQHESKKRAIIYLSLTLGICLLCGILAVLLPDEAGNRVFSFYRLVFTPLPVLAAIFTLFLHAG